MTTTAEPETTDPRSRALRWAQDNPAPRMTPRTDDANPWRAVLVVTDASAFADTYLPPRSDTYRERGEGRFPVEYPVTSEAWVKWLVQDHNDHHARPGAHMEAEPIHPRRPAEPAADDGDAPLRWEPDGPAPEREGLPTKLTEHARRRWGWAAGGTDDADWPVLSACRAVTVIGDAHRDAWSVIAQPPSGSPARYVVGLVVAVGYGDGYELRSATPTDTFVEAVGLMCDGVAGGRLH